MRSPGSRERKQVSRIAASFLERDDVLREQCFNFLRVELRVIGRDLELGRVRSGNTLSEYWFAEERSRQRSFAFARHAVNSFRQKYGTWPWDQCLLKKFRGNPPHTEGSSLQSLLHREGVLKLPRDYPFHKDGWPIALLECLSMGRICALVVATLAVLTCLAQTNPAAAQVLPKATAPPASATPQNSSSNAASPARAPMHFRDVSAEAGLTTLPQTRTDRRYVLDTMAGGG